MTEITFESLKRELGNQATLFQDKVDDGQLENLEYAMRCIQPVRHQEYTFIVWCAVRPESVTEWVDEYVRRRAGQPSQMPDHPMFSLSRWCVPESYRIPVYWEQFQALIKELTIVATCARADEVLTEIVRKKDAGDYLHNLLNARWKDALTANDTELILGIIQDRYPRSSQYAWCSTIVENTITEENTHAE